MLLTVRIGIYKMDKIDILYRGVKVLLPGSVIWKYEYMWFVHANLPIGRLTRVRTVDLHLGESWINSSAGFNPNHNHVNAAPQQASLQTTSRQHHACTMQPPSKITVYKCTRLNAYLWTKNKKERHWPPNILRFAWLTISQKTKTYFP